MNMPMYFKDETKKQVVSKRYVIAKETTDDIIKGKKYELIEMEAMGAYIIDESGEETYYHHTSFKVC